MYDHNTGLDVAVAVSIINGLVLLFNTWLTARVGRESRERDENGKR